ncbi:hypothetical protein LHFGNBLO_005452 [Mesorhizobium sp. AR10]|nr:hypothetical protein LHFGNBLO_005452 [Mesorhizobium sp. AR10]
MVSMRMVGALGLTLAAMTGGAQASSIVILGASTTTPSVVTLGTPEPMKIAASTTPSIVALGDPVPDVTYENVAAIPDKPKSSRGSKQSPMIIRGGIVGGAFASPASAKATAAAPAAVDTKPADETKPAGTATAAAGEAQPESKPKPEPVSPQPEQIPTVSKPM